MTTKIFIGNLATETQSSDLRPLFEKYGKVTECDVLRNYGFVHMDDETEAETAITQLDGYSLHGHRMRVERSTGKKSDSGGKDRKAFRGRGRGDFPSRRGSFDRHPPPRVPYDRYDPYYRYAYPDRDYYRPPPPGDRYAPRLPPPPPGERYAPRDRLSERPLPPPDRRVAYPDPRDRMLPPLRDRYAAYPEERSPYERSPYERARPLERALPADPYYRERSPIARPPPEYYDRQNGAGLPPVPGRGPPEAASRAAMNGQGYPNGYDYYSRPEYRETEYYDRAGAYDRAAQHVPQSSYAPARAAPAASSIGQKNFNSFF